MSKSHRFNPDDPNDSYDRKVRDNVRRRTRQVKQHERTRTEEFNEGANSSHDDPESYPVDAYGDFDYSKYRYGTANQSRYTTAT